MARQTSRWNSNGCQPRASNQRSAAARASSRPPGAASPLPARPGGLAGRRRAGRATAAHRARARGRRPRTRTRRRACRAHPLEAGAECGVVHAAQALAIQPSSRSCPAGRPQSGLLDGPARLHQAQHRVEAVAAGIVDQRLALRVAEHQAQAEPRAPLLERVEQVLARDQALGRLARALVALVGARADQLAREQARIGLQRDPAAVAVVHGRQVHAGLDQRRHAGMQHVGHRRVDPLHRRARPRRRVAGPVRELAAHRPRRAEGGEGVADLRAAERGVVPHQRQPVGGPVQGPDQLARQAEREVEAADPGPGLAQRRRVGLQRGQRLQACRRTRAPSRRPRASVMGLARRGALLKSRPSSCGGFETSVMPRIVTRAGPSRSGRTIQAPCRSPCRAASPLPPPCSPACSRCRRSPGRLRCSGCRPASSRPWGRARSWAPWRWAGRASRCTRCASPARAGRGRRRTSCAPRGCASSPTCAAPSAGPGACVASRSRAATWRVLRTRAGGLRVLPSLLDPPPAPRGRARAEPEAGPNRTPHRWCTSARWRCATCRWSSSTRACAPACTACSCDQLRADLGPLVLPALDQPVPLALEGVVQGPQRQGRVWLQGRVTPASRDARLQARLQGVDLVALQPYLLTAAETGVRRGTLDLKLDASVQGQRLHAPGVVTLTGLEVGNGSGPLGTFAGVPRQAVLAAMSRDGRIELRFTLDGRLDDPRFSLNENIATRLASGLAENLGVSVARRGRGRGQHAQRPARPLRRRPQAAATVGGAVRRCTARCAIRRCAIRDAVTRRGLHGGERGAAQRPAHPSATRRSRRAGRGPGCRTRGSREPDRGRRANPAPPACGARSRVGLRGRHAALPRSRAGGSRCAARGLRARRTSGADASPAGAAARWSGAPASAPAASGPRPSWREPRRRRRRRASPAPGASPAPDAAAGPRGTAAPAPGRRPRRRRPLPRLRRAGGRHRAGRRRVPGSLADRHRVQRHHVAGIACTRIASAGIASTGTVRGRRHGDRHLRADGGRGRATLPSPLAAGVTAAPPAARIVGTRSARLAAGSTACLTASATAHIAATGMRAVAAAGVRRGRGRLRAVAAAGMRALAGAAARAVAAVRRRARSREGRRAAGRRRRRQRDRRAGPVAHAGRPRAGRVRAAARPPRGPGRAARRARPRAPA